MITLESLIKPYANREVEWSVIVIKMPTSSYTKERCEEMLELCDKYNIPYPSIKFTHHTAGHQYKSVYYGYLYLGYYYTQYKYNGDKYNSYIYNTFKSIIDICNDRKVKFDEQALYAINSSSSDFPIIDSITTSDYDTKNNSNDDIDKICKFIKNINDDELITIVVKKYIKTDTYPIIQALIQSQKIHILNNIE